ncbi:hypothetical protein [Natronoglycomyces albus]|uniref:O-antigen ligase domain-containing protein n=1 Tax=Natronoglycomyces albus TaxID=2811108 RepID=A0A895XSG8_9ACTN|nr:hypothetical protein [Natronoglycomyces albus]QSB06175.1 hypothetical protein JQS30_04490 [Natronoglycomyces albus]
MPATTIAGNPSLLRPRPPLLRGEGSILTWLLLFYPLWWALGMGVLIVPLLAVPMTLMLSRQRPVLFPPAFGLWLAFLGVVLMSLSTLPLTPPGTVEASFVSRLPGAGYRLVFYLAVTVVALYAYNVIVTGRYPLRRLINLLAWLFVVTVAGGFLGTLFGYFEYTSPVEALLPASITADGFVQSLVRPTSAQVMTFLGYESPRPAAPWGYTNTWGNNFGILFPWLVVAVFFFPTSTKLRFFALCCLVLSLVPMIYSMNRGLWFNLAIAAAFIALRLLMSGRPQAMLSLAAVTVLTGVIIVATPLGTLVASRFDNPHSDDGRAFASQTAVETTINHSPILGFGSTRNTLGSGTSIAVGPTVDCPRCGNRTLGGNGQLWQVLFAHGLAGLAMYLAFLVAVLWHFRTDHSLIGIVGSTVILMSLTSMFYYNALVTPLLLTLLSYVVLAANHHAPARQATPDLDAPPADRFRDRPALRREKDASARIGTTFQHQHSSGERSS